MGRVHEMFGWWTWRYVRLTTGMRVTIDNEGIDYGAQHVIVPNHRTALDHVLIYVATREVGITDLRWVLKALMRKVPIIGWLCSMHGSAFLSRSKDPKDVDRLARTGRLAEKDGASVIIYPEGTRFRGRRREGHHFAHLHDPKSLGFETLCDQMPGTKVLALTIDWNGLGEEGTTIMEGSSFLGRNVRLRLKTHEWNTRVLDTIWEEHDAYLAQRA